MPENGHNVFRGVDTLFYNSQCLFIEYHDVISIPWFSMLEITKKNQNFMKIFKMEEILNYSTLDLLEWYIYRKHRNVFKSIGTREEFEDVDDSFFNEFLQNCMNSSKDIYKINTKLNFLNSLQILLDEPGLVKKVIIYSENNEPGIEYMIKNIYFKNKYSKIQYMYGNFNDMISLIPRDSTYVFSDIEKVNVLKDNDKLALSSVLIANGFRYNYELNNNKKLKVDIDKLLTKDCIFKYGFFNNFDLKKS